MEKRNTLLLTVIAVATLLVAVVGATFAYFAGTQDVAAGLNLTATTEPASSSFVASSTDPISLEVTSDKMLQSNTDAGVAAFTDNGNLVVTFASAKDGTEMNCSYDVVFSWTGEHKYTAHSSGVTGNEFTISYEVNTTGDTTGKTAEGTAAISKTASGETDFADIDGIAGTANIITGARIYSNSNSAATETNYDFTAKFYNLAADQSGLAGKTFAGSFKVANVQC